MTEVFCDFVSASFESVHWGDVRSQIGPSLDAIGAHIELDTDTQVLWRSGDGTINAKRYGPVMAVGASGAAIAGMRLANVFGKFLSSLGSVPHTVTRLDAARDVVEDTPPVLDRVVSKASSEEGISLTRKRVKPHHVTRLVSRRGDGLDTGTCYVGSRNAEVRAAIYDKRAERVSRGLPDIGPLTRYELRLKSNAGATLRDALDPESLFWHFMAPDVLPRPDGIPQWESHALGYNIDWPDDLTPAQRLVKRLENSADVAALLSLADEVGPHGFDFMVNKLRSISLRSGIGEGSAHVS